MTTNPQCTPENIYGDSPSDYSIEWHVRHDDEIWDESNNYICTCSSAPDAHYIVKLHNDSMESK